jgi:hypothetical protein
MLKQCPIVELPLRRAQATFLEKPKNHGHEPFADRVFGNGGLTPQLQDSSQFSVMTYQPSDQLIYWFDL